MATSLSDSSSLSKSQKEVIYSVLEDLKLNNKDVTVEPLGEAGDNFMADVRVIKIKDQDEKNEFKIIMKLSPGVKESSMIVLTTAFFNNEILMYTEVLPAFSELQEKAGIKLKDTFQFATCYGFHTEQQQEVILLENLLKYDYTMLDKFKPLSSETIKIVLTNLAKYHSLSYALKDKSPVKFKELAKKFVGVNDIIGSQQYNMLGIAFSQMFDKEKYNTLIQNLFTQSSMEKSKKIDEMDSGSKYSVIIHGDMWTNNILFKVDGDKTTDCIFIDYQLVKESMPVVDILYLIFNCTDYETRARHYDDWLNHYHTQLEQSLFNFGLRINNVYPRDKLDSDMMRYAKQVLMMAIMTTSVLLRKKEESAEFKEAMNDSTNISDMVDSMKISSLQMESAMKIKERIEGLIDSCFELGLVNAV